MKLYVTCCGWGARKASDGDAGLLLLDFDAQTVLQRHDCKICPAASRSFSGLACGDEHLYAVRPANDRHDEIVVFDPRTLNPVETISLPHCCDVHQIDLYDGLLWLTNTNYHR